MSDAAKTETETDEAQRRLWRQRFAYARPNAPADQVERAIDNVMADPFGAYAREIRQTAQRAKERRG